MRYIGIILLLLLHANQPVNDLYITKNAVISIYSAALIEDIKATSQAGVSVFNATTGELDFSVAINALKFEKSFMQQHFNSDYMESDKYPRAIFKGKIQEPVDITRDGTHAISAAGELTIHGVSKQRTVQGTLTVRNGTISVTSEFYVKCGDHRVDIPQILFYHIAENIRVNVSATYTAYTIKQAK